MHWLVHIKVKIGKARFISYSMTKVVDAVVGFGFGDDVVVVVVVVYQSVT